MLTSATLLPLDDYYNGTEDPKIHLTYEWALTLIICQSSGPILYFFDLIYQVNDRLFVSLNPSVPF
jgi:hypothetical protein